MRRQLALTLLLLLVPSARADAATSGRCWVTGYVATGFPTATGVWPRVHHTIAALPRFLPYGTHVRIGGLSGVYRVEDTGGLAWGQLDVFVATTRDAYALTGYRSCRWW